MIAAEFYDLCDQHDWTYNFSDDHGVWQRGEAERRRLVALAAENPDFQVILDAWLVWYTALLAGESPEQPSRPKVNTFEGGQLSIHPDQLRLI